MATGIITRIEHNQSFVAKSGKTIDCSILHWTTEGGKNSKDRILPFGDSESDFKLLQTLAPSDQIEFKMKKLDSGAWVPQGGSLKLVEKGNGEVPAPKAFGGGGKPQYVESPEKQASIQRQNALTNATSLVTAMLSHDMYKKTIKPELLVDEILKIADAMYGYTSGESKIEKLTSVIPNASATPDDDDLPF